jgi:sugar O-acyltransferase (sialic acid O-acetyltransferase NeuD family)
MNVIFGASGFAKEVEFIISRLEKVANTNFNISYFVSADDDVNLGKMIKNIPVISEDEFYRKFSNIKVNCFIAVGSPKLKMKIVNRLKNEATPNFPILIDPSVYYDKRPNAINFQEGAIVCGHTILTTDIHVGSFAHINIDSTVGHDANIGDYVTLSPGVHISGNVKICENVFVGTGAVILENITIANEAVIGAGAVVVSNISISGTYVGIPARKVGC